VAAVRSDPSAVVTAARQEYRLAFDLAGARLARDRDDRRTLLIVASAPVLLREALLRADGKVSVIPDAPAVAAAEGFLTRNPVAPYCLENERADAAGSVAHWGVLWASPQPSTWRARLDAVDDGLAGEGVLALLVGGALASALTPFRASWGAGEPRWPAGTLRQALARRGYRLEERSGAGGLASIVWGALGHLALRAGRADLADRCEAGYRRTLESPRTAGLAWTELLVYRKGRR